MSLAGNAPRRIHIDTDPGLDDLLALALALASPEIELVGVSTVSGNAKIDAVTENAQRFLALLGSRVPLGRGAAEPLGLSAQRAEHFHGTDGRRGLHIPALDRHKLPSAREVLRASLCPGGAEALVALGPLTNVAALLSEEPERFGGVELVWMGGTLGRGNATALAEFNCFADPRALEIVLASDLALRVIGLEVTETVEIAGHALEASAKESAIGRLLSLVLGALAEAERPLRGAPRACLHDPCALFAAFAPELFRYEPKHIAVAVVEGIERGRLREIDPARARAVAYASEVRSHDLAQEFCRRLASLCAEAHA